MSTMSIEAEEPSECPSCRGEVTFGYGLAGGTDAEGNPRGYVLCLDCEWTGPTSENVACFPFGIGNVFRST